MGKALFHNGAEVQNSTREEKFLKGNKDRQSMEDFKDNETILYITTMMYTFVKTHRMYNTNSELYLKLWTLGDDNMSMQVLQ